MISALSIVMCCSHREKLGAAGLESGHAYGKSLRTVKSCVGSTWCRCGMADAIGFAVRVENRYKGLRSPHTIKGGVSGCTRECSEAQSLEFGLIATETGYNLYVGGNGGTQPKHAELLATGIDEDTCIKYIDRYLMFYVATADRLERTARWQERLEGGERLFAVVADTVVCISSIVFHTAVTCYS
jgi:nitrite reductase (NADH) large subunit